MPNMITRSPKHLDDNSMQTCLLQIHTQRCVAFRNAQIHWANAAKESNNFFMLVISHIGISPTAGECYFLNTLPVASQRARQLLSSSHPMIFRLLPLVPQCFEKPVSCTNPTKEISHAFTFKYHLLYLFWFSTSQVLPYDLFWKNSDRHMQAPVWRQEFYKHSVPILRFPW